MAWWQSGAHAYSLTVGGVDVIGSCPVDEYPIRWEENGANAVGSLTFTVHDRGATVPIHDRADVRLTDHTNSRTLWGGTLIRRRFRRAPGRLGRLIECEAVSYDSWLDWRIVPRWSSRTNTNGRIYQITSDKVMVQRIVRDYAGMLFAGESVDETNTDMPVVRLRGATVREALEEIANAAQSDASPSVRRFYVGPGRALHWYAGNEGDAAPYRISDVAYTTTVKDTSGIVSLWSLAEASGTAAYDAKGYATATLAGTYTRGLASALVGEPQKTATSFATDAYATASGANLHPGDTFSVEAMFKRTTTGSAQAIISAGSGDYEIGFDSSDRVVVIKEGTGNNFVSTPTYTDTSWHHLLVTRSPGTTTVYVDGSSVAGTDTARTFVAAAGAVNIGRRLSSTDRYFGGRLAHVAVYSTELSAATALAHYRAAVSLAAEDLWLEYDSTDTRDAVYVRGANNDGSGWVHDVGSDAELGEMRDWYERPNADTVAERNRVGKAWLRRHRRITAGTCRIVGVDGWRAGQLLYITDAAFGLSNDGFEIKQVRGEATGLTIAYDLDFGALRRSLLREIRRRR